MTPYELAQQVKGWAQAREDARELAAWQTAYLVNCWTKSPVTPAELLGRTIDINHCSSVEDMDAVVRAHRARKQRG